MSCTGDMLITSFIISPSLEFTIVHYLSMVHFYFKKLFQVCFRFDTIFFDTLVFFRVPGNIAEELVLRTRLLDFFIMLNLSRHIFFKSLFLKFSGHPKGLKVGESWGKKKYRFCEDTSAAKLYRTLNNLNDVPLREYKLMLSFQTR